MIEAKENITGRDGWIIKSALATALVAMERLPEDRRPRSDMDDIRRLLGRGDPGTVSLLMAQAKCRVCPELDAVAVFREYGILDGGSATA